MSALRDCFGDVERVLVLPYANSDHDGCLRAISEGFGAGYVFDGIHRYADPIEAVLTADAIYVSGGNTFRLTAELWNRRLLDPIRRRVREGTPYFGVSAGANVAGPSLRTTNDMPILLPASFETLGLVPFQVNPHYYPGPIFFRIGDAWHEHYGETREDRIREFHELNDAPVLGLFEGAVLRVEGGAISLDGAPARLFRRGRAPVELEPGSVVDLAA